ncbi:hypothetical protein H6F44_22540 [Pseudanabaena sp. FACHB-1277]|uniref:Uncharacterized protein n=1 Tax=Pseudanabaena cinerea FACHB-1277 TaxID=2949581 RepID=A0A926UXZ7_9CYAN|nr:hypothetical protein [Pseudanabaena cinerea]MBD2152866.1 hypothetical protein [Pseudanabaena cinerea FACHB-1277]
MRSPTNHDRPITKKTRSPNHSPKNAIAKSLTPKRDRPLPKTRSPNHPTKTRSPIHPTTKTQSPNHSNKIALVLSFSNVIVSKYELSKHHHN